MNPYDENSEQERDEDRERLSDELNRLMATKWGRSLTWRLLGRAGVFRLSHTGKALSTAFNEGGRNQGLRLMNDLIEFCPEQYARMTSENSGK